MPRPTGSEVAHVLTGVAVGFAAVLVALGGPAESQINEDARLRRLFARPSSVPHPPDNMPSTAKIALGERLFKDTRLSSNGRVSCATCHDPKLGFADGALTSTAGTTGRALTRHTPSLWNVAWAPHLMWDGRATSLEAQSALPISAPDEMASSPVAAASKLADDPEMRAAFSAAFPDVHSVSADSMAKALAAYQRTLVSPPTRFDRWVAGEAAALSVDERRGLSLFAGRARCTSCHIGFAFTDLAFHDIGLPTTDRGRGPVTGLAAAKHAFKTPTLRELSWTAPYMHDGSLATLEDVVQHYERGGIARASRSYEMPKALKLTEAERRALVAFLETLSSDSPPRPSDEPWVGRSAVPEPVAVAVGVRTISQRDRAFAPAAVKVRPGHRITILNDDTRAHNVRIASPALDYNSGLQEPGESVTIRLDRTGTFEAHCGIHPTMRLRIEVE